MKTISLLYDKEGFRALTKTGDPFSMDVFRQECVRQGILGSKDIRVRLLVPGRRFLLMPEEFDEKQLLAFHFPSISPDEFISLSMGDAKQKMVVEVEQAVCQRVATFMPNCVLVPKSFLMARYAMELAKRALLFVYFDSTSLCVFAARQHRLLFANSFAATDDVERRYFVLSVQQEFAHASQCVLCADQASLLEASNLSALLKPSFKHLETMVFCGQQASVLMSCLR